jgi:hypothetical protein
MQSITILHRNDYSQITLTYIFYHSQDKTKTTEILNLAKMYKHTPDVLHSIRVLFSEAMKIFTPFFCYPLTWNM